MVLWGKLRTSAVLATRRRPRQQSTKRETERLGFSDSRVRDHTANAMESTLRQTGCSNRSGRKAGAIALLYVLPANRHKKRADERTRTADLLITSELLYLLSYVGLFRAQSIS